MKSLFIAGTDTGVGKTIMTASLAAYVQSRGGSVITQKWIQTGFEGFASSDIGTHLNIMGRTKEDIQGYLGSVMPYAFKMASAPLLASRCVRRKIDTIKIIKSFNRLSAVFDHVFVEGIGGVLVPYQKKRLVIDIVRELKLPVLVVAENKLGAINQTLLTIEALRARRLQILGIVFNEGKNEDQRILEDNPRVIRELTGCEVFGTIPYARIQKQLRASFLSVAAKICRRLT